MATIDPKKPVFSIGVAADILGVHPRTLRIYEEKGLIRPARTDGDRRRYSLEDLRKIRLIRHLTQGRGVNLAGVSIILDMLQIIEAQGIDYTARLYPGINDLRF